jgi:nucleoside-diphosphate-sugar epimerase
MKARDILVTGFPSFVARRLVQTILAHEPDSTIRLLVRPDYVDAAARHLSAMKADRERVRIMSGDVVSLDLGLGGGEYLDVVAHVTDVYHIASIWYLGVEPKQTQQVNVQGATNILDAAHEMKRLERLNHFSTALVAGDRGGVIMEDELEAGQGFRNPYEATKYEAEQWMRRAMRNLPISVYRPTVIVGDSKTGEIDKMAGPYYLMYAITRAPANMPIVLPGRGEKPLNLVPIDYVCEAMYTISMASDCAGKTFHLCDPNPLSARKVFELVAELAGKPAPIGGAPIRLARLAMRLPYVERFMRGQRQFLEELYQLTIYNSMNTTAALAGRVPCPALPDYLDNLVTYIRRSESSLDIEMPAITDILG